MNDDIFFSFSVFERDISWAKRYSMLYIDNPVSGLLLPSIYCGLAEELL